MNSGWIHAGTVIALWSLLGIAGAKAAGHSPAGHSHNKSAAHAGHSHDDHHLCESDIDMPKDYAAAVKRIKKCRATIADEIAEGHWEEVHSPLDEATIILNKIMPIARNSGVPKSRWQDVNLAAKELKKRLDGLHSAIDKSGTADFNAAAKAIDDAIGRLESAGSGLSLTAKRTAQPPR